MRSSARQKLFLWVLVAILSLVGPLTDAYAQKEKDIIIIIDISTSMAEQFDTVQKEARSIVSAATPGDRITVITFGASSHLLERRRIQTRDDIREIVEAIDQLAAIEFVTNLPVALERGLRELTELYEEDSQRDRIVFWLSDDKNNPPKDIPNLITFNTLKQEKMALPSDPNWFEFKPVIQPEAQSPLRSFVNWANRLPMSVIASLSADDSDLLVIPECKKIIQVSFEPDSVAAWGSLVTVVAEITDRAQKSLVESVPVDPPLMVCDGSPWLQEFSVTLPERAGDYVCRIRFIASDEPLKISPAEISVNARVQDKIATVASIDGAHESERLLDDAVPAGGRNPDAARTVQNDLQPLEPDNSDPLRKSLVLGPVNNNKTYRETVFLYPTKNIPLESVRMETSFQKGNPMRVESTYRILDGKLVADLLFAAAADAKAQDEWNILGHISFYSTEKNVKIYPEKIPVRLWARKDDPLRETNTTLTLLSRYRIIDLDEVARRLPFYLLVGLPGPLVFLVIFFVFRNRWLKPTMSSGTLEQLYGGPDNRLKSFNLKRIGRRRRSNALVIGSSEAADISLTGDSVASLHARIMTRHTNAQPLVLIEPIGATEILVNGIPCRSEKEIWNGDLISIGHYQFAYKCPKAERKILVQLKDGKLIRGALLAWDIEANSFELLPAGAPSENAIMILRFSEVRTVSFLREKPPSRLRKFFSRAKMNSANYVEMVFEDGQMLEGYTLADAGAWQKRFYIIPKKNEDVGFILVERSAVQHFFRLADMPQGLN